MTQSHRLTSVNSYSFMAPTEKVKCIPQYILDAENNHRECFKGFKLSFVFVSEPVARCAQAACYPGLQSYALFYFLARMFYHCHVQESCLCICPDRVNRKVILQTCLHLHLPYHIHRKYENTKEGHNRVMARSEQCMAACLLGL
jgi:hypothetical protein